jgi:hypothetical protein
MDTPGQQGETSEPLGVVVVELIGELLALFLQRVQQTKGYEDRTA